MPPKFSLQSVLDYYHSRVETLEVELGRLLQAQQQAQAYLETLKANQVELFEKLRHKQMGPLDLTELDNLRLNLKIVETRIEQQLATLAALAQQIVAQRQLVVAARQDEETLNILKEKEEARFRAEEVKHENRLREDIYISQAHRRASSGSAGRF
jgi:flagellar export protein FliJ